MSSGEARYLKISFDEVFQRLRDYAKRKAETCKVKAIVLIGSLAKGNYTGTSDADILVIAEDLPRSMHERYSLFSEPNMPVDLEPRAYTPIEFVEMIAQGDRFALESLDIGMPLYGDQYFRNLKRQLNEVPRKA